MNHAWKNPYSRAHSSALPIENPIAELQEDELLRISGAEAIAPSNPGLANPIAPVSPGWAETVLTTLLCAAASYFIGNKGHICTLTVECQKSCN